MKINIPKYVPKTKEEADYIEAFDPTVYALSNPAVAVDMVLFSYDKKLKKIKTLLIERGGFPYRGDWAYPGGFIEKGESLDEAVQRELKEETGVEGVFAEIFNVMGEPDRDPRQRNLSPEFLAFMDHEKLVPKAGDDAAKAQWFDVESFEVEESCDQSGEDTVVVQNISLVLKCGDVELNPQVRRTMIYSDHISVEDDIVETGGFGFDHAAIAIYGFMALRNKLENTDIAYNIFNGEFGMEELQGLYYAAGVEGKTPRLLPNGKYTFKPSQNRV